MNSKDLNPNYKKLYMILESVFEKIGYFNYGHHDETLCTMRVFETAKELISKLDLDVNKEVILTATILHDIGKSVLDLSLVTEPHTTPEIEAEWNSHIKKSVPLAKAVLLDEGHSDEFVNKVCFLIGHHNIILDGLAERSIELQILQDADLIADCGIVDFMRGLSYGAINKRPLIGSIKYFLSKVDRVQESGRLNLDISKVLVKERLDFYDTIMVELSKLVDSELLN